MFLARDGSTTDLRSSMRKSGARLSPRQKAVVDLVHRDGGVGHIVLPWAVVLLEAQLRSDVRTVSSSDVLARSCRDWNVLARKWHIAGLPFVCRYRRVRAIVMLETRLPGDRRETD